MRSYIKAASIVFFLLIWAVSYFYRSGETKAQNLPEQPYLSANKQQSQFPTNVNLECSGCHGAGKTLPFLAGELFHKDTHGKFDVSIHNRTGANGKSVASCKDCHTINGDMTTALPAVNPKSTINRVNIAVTCGKCHGDKSVIQGSGISDRPILSYR